MWLRASFGLVAALAIPGIARADPPATIVVFGSPAPELTVIAPPVHDASRARADGSAQRGRGTVAPREGETRARPRDEAASDAATDRAAGACPRAITIVRRRQGRREQIRMALLDCEGRPREEALRALSIMARPRARDDAPSEDEMRAWREADGDPELLAADVRRLHPGLLERLQHIGEAFDPAPIEIVSGYRPESSAHSRHHHGRALDIVIPGLPREALRDLAITFPQTGVGWYPNSVFVHVDVREESAYWVDLSGPGERPRYVRGAEPPTPSDAPELDAAADIEEALAAVRQGVRVPSPTDAHERSDDASTNEARDTAELERMRRETAEALRAIQIPSLR